MELKAESVVQHRHLNGHDNIINLQVNSNIISSCDFLFPHLSLLDRWREQDKGKERDRERKEEEEEEEQ